MATFEEIKKRYIEGGADEATAAGIAEDKIRSDLEKYPDQAEVAKKKLFPDGKISKGLSGIFDSLAPIQPEPIEGDTVSPPDLTKMEDGAGQTPGQLGVTADESIRQKVSSDLGSIGEPPTIKEVKKKAKYPEWAPVNRETFNYITKRQAEGLSDDEIRADIAQRFSYVLEKAPNRAAAKMAMFARFGLKESDLFGEPTLRRGEKTKSAPRMYIPQFDAKTPPVKMLPPDQAAKLAEGISNAPLATEVNTVPVAAEGEIPRVDESAGPPGPSELAMIEPEKEVVPPLAPEDNPWPARISIADVNPDAVYSDIKELDESGLTDAQAYEQFANDYLNMKVWNDRNQARDGQFGEDEYDQWTKKLLASPKDMGEIKTLADHFYPGPDLKFGFIRWGDMPEAIKNFKIRVGTTVYQPFSGGSPDEKVLSAETAAEITAMLIPEKVLLKAGWKFAGSSVAAASEGFLKNRPLIQAIMGRNLNEAKKFVGFNADMMARIFPFAAERNVRAVADAEKTPLQAAAGVAAEVGMIPLATMLMEGLIRTPGAVGSVVPQGVKDFYEKWFTREGAGGAPVLTAKILSEGTRAGMMDEMNFITSGMVKAMSKMKKDYPEVASRLDDYLRGYGTLESLPLEIQDLAQSSREAIDRGSQIIADYLRADNPAAINKGIEIEHDLIVRYTNRPAYMSEMGVEDLGLRDIEGFERELHERCVAAHAEDYLRYRTIRDNLGRYLIRAYRAIQEKPQWKILGMKIGGFKADPEKIKKVIAATRERDPEMFMVPSRNGGLGQLEMDIKKENGEWVARIPKKPGFRNMTDDEILAVIENTIEEYGDLAKSTGMGGARVSGEVFKQKKEIMPEWRDLMGEYTDPIQLTQLTLMKLSKYAQSSELMRFLSGVDGVVYKSAEAIEAAGKRVVDFEKVEDSRSFGYMAGKWIQKDVYNSILESGYGGRRGMAGEKGLLDALNAISTTPFKKAHTIYSIAGQFRNYFSNPLIAAVAKCGLGPQNAEYYSKMIDMYLHPYSPENKELTRWLFKIGARGESFVDQDILQNFKQGIFNPDRFQDNMAGMVARKAMAAPGNLAKSFEKSWRFADECFKVAGALKWLDTRGAMSFSANKRGFMPTANLQDDALASDASKYIGDFYMDYAHIPKIIADTRAIPILGMFVSFQVNAWRIARNALTYGAKEMAQGDPSRLISLGAAMYGPTMATKAYMASQFDKPTLQKLHLIEAKMPSFMRGGTWIPTKNPDEYYYLSLNFVDPWNMTLPNFLEFTDQSGPGAVLANLANNMNTIPYFQIARAMAKGETDRGKILWNEKTPTGEKALAAAKFAATNIYLPPEFPVLGYNFQNIMKSVGADEESGEFVQPALLKAIGLIGFKVTKIKSEEEENKLRSKTKKGLETVKKQYMQAFFEARQHAGPEMEKMMNDADSIRERDMDEWIKSYENESEIMSGMGVPGEP